MLLQLEGMGEGKRPLDPGHFLNYLAAIQGLQQQGQVHKTVSAQPEGNLQASQVVKDRQQLRLKGGSTENRTPQSPEPTFQPGPQLLLGFQHCRVHRYTTEVGPYLWLSFYEGTQRSWRISERHLSLWE